MRIYKKMVFAFGITTLLPLLFIGILLTSKLEHQALTTTRNGAFRDIERLTGVTKDSLSKGNMVMNEIIADPKLYEIAHGQYEKNYDLVMAYKEYTKIRTLESLYSDIEDIRVYIDRSDLLSDMDLCVADEAIKGAYWYQQSQFFEGQVRAFYYMDPLKKKPYLAMSRSYTTLQDIHLTLLVLLPLEGLRQLEDQMSYPLYLVDESGRLLVGPSSTQVGDDFYEITGFYPNNKVGHRRDIFKGVKSEIFVQRIQVPNITTSLYTVAGVDLDQILRDSRGVRNLSYVIMTISILVTMLMIAFLSGWFLKGLKGLLKSMTLIGEGKEPTFEMTNPKDEFAKVEEGLIQMSRNLQEVMRENMAIKDREKAYFVAREQMRFDVLSSQLNPHFLFNMLETFRMKALSSQAMELATMVKHLAGGLRRNLEMTHQVVTIEEELKFVESYLLLQKFRFEERLSYEINVHPQCLQMEVLPLMIQPLIENAVVHGLECLKEGGKVYLNVYEEQGFLYVCIEDNGVGMTKEEVLGLKYGAIKAGRRPIGIKNIEQRIDFFYKKEGSLTIESTYGQGTRVTLVLPVGGPR